MYIYIHRAFGVALIIYSPHRTGMRVISLRTPCCFRHMTATKPKYMFHLHRWHQQHVHPSVSLRCGALGYDIDN